jgi:energy-coupling factor transporter transmembrane protein EcfT
MRAMRGSGMRPASFSTPSPEHMSAGAGGAAPEAAHAGLHPAFRIVLLLVLAGMLFRYSLAAMAVVLGLLLLGAAVTGPGMLRGILRALRRIRWLLLSIVVIYLWVAPEPGIAGRPWYLPSWGELDTALRRSGVLVVLVTAVELLRRNTEVPRMAAGVVMLLSPLARLGVDTGVFARRLALTLEAVPLTAEHVAQAAARHRIRRGMRGWGDVAAALIRDIESGAATPSGEAKLPRLRRPTGRDWGLLAAGVLACLLAGAL